MQDLERKFEKYGPVKDARIVRNPRSGESRGFGFLIMENDDDVDRVCYPNGLYFFSVQQLVCCSADIQEMPVAQLKCA